MKKKNVIIVGGGSPIDPEVIKKLAEAGVSDIVAVDSLPDELTENTIKRPSFHVPDMDEIMITVKNKEAARKKRLRDMGRAQFKKKNRRKF